MARFISNCSSSSVCDSWSRHQCSVQMPCSALRRLSAHNLVESHLRTCLSLPWWSPSHFLPLHDWVLVLLDTLCLYHRVHYDDVMVHYAGNSLTWLDKTGSLGDVEVNHNVFQVRSRWIWSRWWSSNMSISVSQRVFLSLPGANVLSSQSMSSALKSPARMIGKSESRLFNWSSLTTGVCRCMCWLRWLGKMQLNSLLAVVLCWQGCCDLSGETMLVSRRQSHRQVWMPGARICCALWRHKNGRRSLRHFVTCTWCSSTTNLLFPRQHAYAWLVIPDVTLVVAYCSMGPAPLKVTKEATGIDRLVHGRTWVRMYVTAQ